MENFDKEVQLIHELITNPVGFDVGCFGYITLSRNDESTWVLEIWGDESDPFQQEFSDPQKAAKEFVKLRHELKLGFDFSKEERKTLVN